MYEDSQIVENKKYIQKKLVKPLFRSPLQCFPMIWVCYGNKCFCTLLQTFSKKIHYSVFSNHIMHVSPCGSDAGSFL